MTTTLWRLCKQVPWLRIGRGLLAALQLLAIALVMALDLTWQHRQEIRAAAVRVIAAVAAAAQISWLLLRRLPAQLEALSSAGARINRRLQRRYPQAAAFTPIAAGLLVSVAASRAALLAYLSRRYGWRLA